MRQIYIYSFENLYDYRIKHGDIPLLKIGDTTRENVLERLNEQDTTSNAEKIKLLYKTIVPEDFMPFIEHIDKEFHKFLQTKNIYKYRKDKDREWFELTLDDAVKYLNEFIYGSTKLNAYKMREPQQEAHDKIVEYFKSGGNEFLLAAKMRFGKNFTLLQTIKSLNYKNILVLTYKPNVFASLKDDIETHIDFENFNYINLKDDRNLIKYNSSKTNIIVCSAQLAGYSEYETDDENIIGDKENIFLKNIKYIKDIHFECILVDESHFGSSTSKFKEILSKINYDNIIYISGTAFRDLNSGRFSQEQIYSYDYIDECKYQDKIKHEDIELYNKIKLPTLNIYGITLDSSVVEEAHKYYIEDEYPKFGKVFATDNNGAFINNQLAFMTLCHVFGKIPGKSVSPFKNIKNAEYPNHIFLTCPGVNSGNAIYNMINEKFSDQFYPINACGNNIKTVNELKQEISYANHENKISITISCNRFKEGVSIPEWNTIIFLDDSSSPIMYFQTLFRGQTPSKYKNNFYVYDFNPERMLSMSYIANENQSIVNNKNTYEYIKEYLDCVNIFTFDSEHRMNKINFEDLQNAYSKYEYDANIFGNHSMINIKNIKTSDINIFDKLTKENLNQTKKFNVTSNGVSDGKINKLIKMLNECKDNKNKIKNKDDINNIIKCINSLISKLPEIMFFTGENETSFDSIIESINNDKTYQYIFKEIIGTDYSILQSLKELKIINETLINRAIMAYNNDEDFFMSNISLESYNNFFNKWFKNTKTIVRTPISVVSKMLVDIDDDIYKNPNLKFCDACCKESTFLLYLKEKLLKYHSEEYICNNMLYAIVSNETPHVYESEIIKTVGINKSNVYRNEAYKNSILYYINDKKIDINNMPKFDFIIQNPPYQKSFHLNFLENGYDMLSDNGKMVIIEPSTWLINIRKEGKAKLYDAIKEKTKGHIYKVILENYNKEFNTGMYMPFAITFIDKEKSYKQIEFSNCGEEKTVDSIYDCNLVGDYNIIHSILNKCRKYGDMMNDHIYKNQNIEDKYFVKIPGIIGGSGSQLCGIFDCGRRKTPITKFEFDNFVNYNIFTNNYLKPYYHSLFFNNTDIYDKVPERKNKGNKLIPGSVANCLFGTKEELENWKHFVFNNKLPLFINICVTIDQNNNSGKYVPWLTDKQYTDEEIYNLLGITEEEQKVIDNTLEKFERYSPWFKRYMCGLEK